MSRYSLPALDQMLLRQLLFDPAVPACLPQSNQHVRHASRLAFIDVAAAAILSDPENLYFVTLAGARGATVLDRPRLDLRRFQAAADAALRARGLSGFASFEFDIIKPRPRQRDAPVLFHCHGLFRSTDPALTLANLKESLAACRAFPEWDGAVGAHIKTITRADLDAHRIAVYFADPFHQLKRIQPNPDRPGRNKLRATRNGLTAQLVLRATELQSHLRIRDTVFGVGAYGKQLRAEWWRRFQAHLPRAAINGPDITPEEITELWHNFRRADRTARRFGTVRLVTRSSAYRQARDRI